MEAEPKRRWYQFSLRTLLIGVLAVSFALAAMRFANSAWANVVINLTIFALLFSVVLAVYRQPFWVGFAVCGIGYLVLVESHFDADFVNRLITTRAVESLRDIFHPEADYLPADSGALVVQWNEMASNFYWIGTCLSAMIVGTLGGILAQFAAGRPNRAAGPTSDRAS